MHYWCKGRTNITGANAVITGTLGYISLVPGLWDNMYYWCKSRTNITGANAVITGALG